MSVRIHPVVTTALVFAIVLCACLRETPGSDGPFDGRHVRHARGLHGAAIILHTTRSAHNQGLLDRHFSTTNAWTPFEHRVGEVVAARAGVSFDRPIETLPSYWGATHLSI